MPSVVLLIDDSPAIHRLVAVHLRDEDVELLSAFDSTSGCALAKQRTPDVILLDVRLPDIDGYQTCRLLKSEATTGQIPIVFLTASDSVEEKIRGLDLGASDYITKPFDVAELKARLRVALRTKRLMDLLAERANIDALTALPNRASFEARKRQERALAIRHRRPLACLMADIDHFKQINDCYGHLCGDEVLRRVAQAIQDECRDEDVPCRYGGEEFAILTPGVDAARAAALAERIRARIAALEIPWREHLIRLTCSLGVADLATSGEVSLIEAADRALYAAKHAGRNRIVVATGTSGRKAASKRPASRGRKPARPATAS